jgi:hypothetical protein
VEAAGWRKPRRSFSNGNCAEVGREWRTAEASMANGQCVEAGQGEAVVLVRDTKDRDGLVLAFPAKAWRAFTERMAIKVPRNGVS